MRILFLEIDTESDWAVASIGPAFLAAYLRPHGHEVSSLRVPLGMGVAKLAAAVGEDGAELLAVSLTTRQWQRARTVIGELRNMVDLPVVAGGLHPTFSPEDVLSQPGFDFVCLGEGEAALLDLVEVLAVGDGFPTDPIENIWVKGGERPTLRPPLEPIDDLPFMARDMLDERYGVVHFTTQRGCPFPCTYCAANRYHELYGRASAYGRRRSHESVIAELAHIQQTGPLNYVVFLDDTFTIYPTWVAEFCRVYGRRFSAPFSLHARADTVDEEMIAMLAGAGCKHIVYGVESGSLRIRQEVMHRPISNERMIDVFEWTRRAGILVTANYMLGLPGETREDLEQTLALHEQLQPDDFGFFVFYPYPGTRLFHVCREQGYLPDDYLDRPANHRESILNLPDLSKADITEYYDRFTALRERETLKRYGGANNAETQAEIAHEVRQCAATG